MQTHSLNPMTCLLKQNNKGTQAISLFQLYEDLEPMTFSKGKVVEQHVILISWDHIYTDCIMPGLSRYTEVKEKL